MFITYGINRSLWFGFIAWISWRDVIVFWLWKLSINFDESLWFQDNYIKYGKVVNEFGLSAFI